ncbi:toprim domain-containing protein [Legionella spiritensis]|uniref:Toprim domain-containing protein n=1 Tax=Legionella spiritensis TaxID=452 RepID=A0A0W0Z8V1_LEGSP|nr:toprim domain-containing protein [Legionella spiritensis]KTD65342.1 hypothetical protein Lspi_0659 [Legionella spiritensis]SNV47392.1 TraI [Legionella spiritensis]
MKLERVVGFSKIDEHIRDKVSIRQARKLWERGVPINNSPAEQYLVNTRHIPQDVARKLDVRSLKGPIGIPYFDKNHPYDDYLVSPVLDLDHQLIGVQLIQIDKQGNKAKNVNDEDYYCKKYIGAHHPAREGSAAIICFSNDANEVYVAEGIETAASIASIRNIAERHTVLASLSVNKLTTTLEFIKTHFPPDAKVVLLKDHDSEGSIANKEFEHAREAYLQAGYQVVVKEPVAEGDDWNDVLTHQGVEALELEFGSTATNNASLSDGSDNDNDGSLQLFIEHFKNIYGGLLSSESYSEKKKLLAVSFSVLAQLKNELNAIDDEQDIGVQIRTIDQTQYAMVVVSTLLSELTGQQLSSWRPKNNNFAMVYKELCRLEREMDDALREDDAFKSESKELKGHLYLAYHRATMACHACISALHPETIKDVKIQTYHANRLKRIDEEIIFLQKTNRPTKKDSGEVTELYQLICNLKQEKKFHREALQKLQLQWKYPGKLSLAGKRHNPYVVYYNAFINEARIHFDSGVFNRQEIRKILEKKYKTMRSQLQAEHRKKIEAARQRCLIEMRKMIAPLTVQMDKLAQIASAEQFLLTKQRAEAGISEFERNYLLAMENLQDNPWLQKRLQLWINQLHAFKMVSPCVYFYPEETPEINAVSILDEDSDEEGTLSDLTESILSEQFGSPCEINFPEVASQPDWLSSHSPGSATMKYIANLCGIAFNELDERLYLTIIDFSERLALNLYKSFEVIEPGKNGNRQEFDGLVLRNRQLTIIERKSNDGTGPGLLQRNFCQNKILSKEDYLRKKIIDKIVELPTSEQYQYIVIAEPGREYPSWYSPEFNEQIRENLLCSAKWLVIKALQDMHLELNLNRPQFYTGNDCEGLFFNQGLIRSGVTVRFSRKEKGNEDCAHKRMETVVLQRTEKRDKDGLAYVICGSGGM